MISAPGEYGPGRVNGVNGTMSEKLSETTGRYMVVPADNVFGDVFSDEAASRTALQSIVEVSNITSASDLVDDEIDIVGPGLAQAPRYDQL